MYVDRVDLIVFVIVLGFGFGAFLYGLPTIFQTGSGVNSSHSCLNPDVTVSTDCYVKRAATDGLSTCSDAPDSNACAGYAVFNQSNVSSCLSWSDPDGCRYFYYDARLAHDADSLSYVDAMAGCASIVSTGWRISCLEDHAVRLNNSVYCQPIPIPSYQDECVQMVLHKK